MDGQDEQRKAEKIALLFDQKILDLCTLDNEAYEEIKKWMLESGDLQRDYACKVICNLLGKMLGDDLSDLGRQKLPKLQESLRFFEDVIITTKSGLEKRFYRDHLNHSIRVALLANAIASWLVSAGILTSETDIISSTIAGLSHDIGYPPGQAAKTFELIRQHLQECYSTIRLSEPIKTYTTDTLTRDVPALKLDKMLGHPQLIEVIDDANHGVLSALELMRFVKSDPIESNPALFNALQAVALHDGAINVSIRFSELPVAAILIISDELQEWGRPVGFGRLPALSEIAGFTLSDRISGVLDYKSNEKFSCLRQIESKLESLHRLVLDGGFPDFQIVYWLQSFIPIRVKAILKLYTELWDKSTPQAQLLAPRVPSDFRFVRQTKLETENQQIDRLLSVEIADDLFLRLAPERDEALVTTLSLDEFHIKKDLDGLIKGCFYDKAANRLYPGKLLSMSSGDVKSNRYYVSKLPLCLIFYFLPYIFSRIERLIMFDATDDEILAYNDPEKRLGVIASRISKKLGRIDPIICKDDFLKVLSSFHQNIDRDGYFIFVSA